jgi:hypothetical protein
LWQSCRCLCAFSCRFRNLVRRHGQNLSSQTVARIRFPYQGRWPTSWCLSDNLDSRTFIYCHFLIIPLLCSATSDLTHAFETGNTADCKSFASTSTMVLSTSTRLVLMLFVLLFRYPALKVFCFGSPAILLSLKRFFCSCDCWRTLAQHKSLSTCWTSPYVVRFFS